MRLSRRVQCINRPSWDLGLFKCLFRSAAWDCLCLFKYVFSDWPSWDWLCLFKCLSTLATTAVQCGRMWGYQGDIKCSPYKQPEGLRPSVNSPLNANLSLRRGGQEARPVSLGHSCFENYPWQDGQFLLLFFLSEVIDSKDCYLLLLHVIHIHTNWTKVCTASDKLILRGDGNCCKYQVLREVRLMSN